MTVDDALSTSSTNPVQNKVITNTLNGKQATLVSGTNIKTVNGTSILGSGNIVTPDTTYSNATTSAAGLMSASDKSKLDGVAANANNYSLPTATSSILGGVKTGSNITNSSGTISVSKTNVTSALGYTPPTSSVATTSANGLMSSSDKSKLDGIASGATKVTVDSALSSSSTNPVQNKVINTALEAKQNKSVIHSNITVSVTPTQMSSYCEWDSDSKYGYSATVTISGLTANSMVQNLVMNDALLDSVAHVVDTGANSLTFYTEDATALSGTIYTLVTTEVS